MKKVAFIALGIIILFGSYLIISHSYATSSTASTPMAARQNRIKFTCPAQEPTWTCTPTGATKCSWEDIKTMLNFGDAKQVLKLANDWRDEKNVTDPANGPWYPYEYFSQEFGSGFIAGAMGLSAGCTPLHYIACRKCFKGDRSAIDKEQVSAIKEMMSWGIESGKIPKHQYVDPFPFNSACQFAGLHDARAVNGPTVELPATIGYLAAENLNPNVIQAMSALHDSAKNDTDGCKRGVYKNTRTKPYQVFIKEIDMGAITHHVGDAQGPGYATAKSTGSLVSGYDRVCIADFYNSFGNSFNDQRGPSFPAFAQRTGGLTKQWDKDEKNSLGYKKIMQIPHDGTHFVENLGYAIVYGLPSFDRYDSVCNIPSNTIDLVSVENMQKDERLASATLLRVLSEQMNINEATDVAVINKYPEDKYTVAFKKHKKDLYPTDDDINDPNVGGVIATCTQTACRYVNANTKKLMLIELTLDKNDTTTVNADLEKTYISEKAYKDFDKDKM